MEAAKPHKRRRDRRAEVPGRMRLVERDIDIIEAVHQYRVLRQDQLEALFFHTKSAAQRVLARLYDHAFLERKFLPVLYGRSPTLYVLDKRGADLLRAERGYEDLTWYSSNKDLKSDFMEHTSAINDFRLAIVVAARRQGLDVITWASESQLKADYDRVRISASKRPVSLIPDGYFVLGTPRGKAHFFLEIDRGTETLERFKQKIQAYIAYYNSGAFESRYGTKSLRVLTVATGEGRLNNLITATAQVTKALGGKGRFWFSLADKVSTQSVLTEPVWSLAEDETHYMLISPAP